MKVNLFKLNKNKRFNYNPRYLKDKSVENIYDFDSVYEKQRNYRSSYDLSSVILKEATENIAISAAPAGIATSTNLIQKNVLDV